MVKKTVRLTADERAICRVRYKELMKVMDVGSNRSTNEICRAIAAYWKDGDSPETGSEYSALLFPFGNQRAVQRHINEAHVDAADRAIAKKWVKKQPAANQSQIRELLGLNDEGEEDEGTSDPESDADVPPARSRKRKASKAAPGKSKQAAKRRRKEKQESDDVKSESEDDIKSET